MSDEYTIDMGDSSVAVRGILRLESPDAYERILGAVRARVLAAKEPLSLDVTAVTFMNSSGIRALGALVLAAKRAGARFTIRGTPSVPWQKKTLPSLGKLYAGVSVELE